MNTWSYKQIGGLIGAVAILIWVWLGFGEMVAVILGGVVGYFVGSFLDGTLDLSEIQQRARGGRSGY